MKIERRRCHYCGLNHEEVEAAGMYHCPNPTCSGPGATWFRRTLPSYIETSDGKHTVIAEDVLTYGTKYLVEHEELAKELVLQGIIKPEEKIQ